MLEDAELLRRYAEEKSEAAFAELVARYLNLVYSAAMRQVGGDAHRAHDVSQVVFTTLARKAATLVSHPALIGWLYTATQHAAAKAVRAEARRHAREHEAYLMKDLHEPGIENIDWERVRPVLDAAMSELDDRDRQAVLLRYFTHRAFADIGRTLGLSEDAARMRIERALEKLHGLLAKRGVTSTSAALGVALSHQAVLAAPAGMAGGVAGAAVAASAGATGPLAIWISLMTTTKTATSVAGLVLLAAIGGALHETRSDREIQAATALAVTENESLQAKLIELRKREEAVSVAAAETRRLQTGSPSFTPANPPAPLRTGTPADTAAFMAKHPEVRRAILDYYRALAMERFGPFLRGRSLSSAQIDRFLDLADRSLTLNFASNGLRLIYRPEISAEAAKTELQALLGTEGFAQFEEFSGRSDRMNSQIPFQLAAALYRTPTPLTTEQGTRLQDILIARATPVERARPRTDWTAVMQDAQKVLSAPQLTILQKLSVQDRLSQAITDADRVGRLHAPAPDSAQP